MTERCMTFWLAAIKQLKREQSLSKKIPKARYSPRS
jgi:hypothetical protein